MKNSLKQTVFLLRLAMGWLFFYAGITKILDPTWSAAGYLENAQSFSGIYGWLAEPGQIAFINFLNEWGLTLIGAALICGAFTRLASYFGMLLMALYYLPGLDFPYVGHGVLIDEHIIYIFALLLLVELGAGQYWGADEKLKKKLKFKGWWF